MAVEYLPIRCPRFGTAGSAPLWTRDSIEKSLS